MLILCWASVVDSGPASNNIGSVYHVDWDCTQSENDDPAPELGSIPELNGN